jgi:hypothetical protein
MKRIPLLLLALTLATSALAQPVGIEITPIFGFRTGGTIASDLTDVFLDDVKTDESPFYGVIVDIDLSRYWQLELLANHQQSELSYDSGLFEGETGIGDIDITYWQAGLIWRSPSSDVQPFFGFTLGGATIEPQLPGLDAENKFSGSLGGGVKVFLNRNFGIRLEGRGYWTAIDDTRSCCGGDYYDDYWDERDDYLQAEASVGVILAF